MQGFFCCGFGSVLVKGFELSYHTKETILLNIDPYNGNLNKAL